MISPRAKDQSVRRRSCVAPACKDEKMLEGRENGMYSKNIRYIPPDIIPLQMWHKSYKQMDEIIISQHE